MVREVSFVLFRRELLDREALGSGAAGRGVSDFSGQRWSKRSDRAGGGGRREGERHEGEGEDIKRGGGSSCELIVSFLMHLSKYKHGPETKAPAALLRAGRVSQLPRWKGSVALSATEISGRLASRPTCVSGPRRALLGPRNA